MIEIREKDGQVEEKKPYRRNDRVRLGYSYEKPNLYVRGIVLI